MIDFEARRAGIGGSDVAKVLGVSRFDTALGVYARKLSLIDDEAETKAQRSGNRLERTILDGYFEIEPAHTISESELHRHPRLAYLIAHPDRVVGNDFGDVWNVDAKNVTWAGASQWGDAEEFDAIPLPADEYWQGLHYCYVTERRRTDFVVLLAGTWPPRVYHVLRDDARYEQIALPALKAFRECVESQKPPAPDFVHPSTADLLRRMHGRVNRRAKIEISRPQSLLIDALVALTRAEKRIESKKREVQARLMSLMGDAFALIDTETGAKVTRQQVRGGWVNYERKPYAKLIPRLRDRHELRVDVAELMDEIGG